MNKLSDRLQALIADGEIPLSDAWGKLIDDMKATEEQEPVALRDERPGSGGISKRPGFNLLPHGAPLYAVHQPMQDSDAREMLKRLAVIMSGSDAPGEIKALTVTAQSFVDRCKTLARERDAALSGGTK